MTSAKDIEARLDASKHYTLPSDAALLRLYDLLAARNAPEPGSFTTLEPAAKREYFKLSRRRTRARVRASAEAGAYEPTTANIRDALADAALMILAVDAPGAPMVREVLASVFHKRPGVPVTVQTRARTGKLRPKLAGKARP